MSIGGKNDLDLIKEVKALDLPFGEYVVFGSCPLHIHGIRESKDIDLLVSPKLFSQLEKQGWTAEFFESGEKHLTKGIADAFVQWDYGAYNPSLDELIKSADVVEGIPFVCLDEVLKWKKAFGREKDL